MKKKLFHEEHPREEGEIVFNQLKSLFLKMTLKYMIFFFFYFQERCLALTSQIKGKLRIKGKYFPLTISHVYNNLVLYLLHSKPL